MKYKDLSGMKFNRWTVLYQTDDIIRKDGYHERVWICQCSCDKKTILPVRERSLKSGHSKSCGCLRKEKVAINGKNNKKYNQYDLTGEYGIGYTLDNEPFYFDLEDYDKIKKYCWFYDEKQYVKAWDNSRNMYIRQHRLIMGILDDYELEVDHIKHKNYDNRKSQLRICRHQLNTFNTVLRKDNTSNIKGVYWNSEKNKWAAQIMINQKKIHLGYFNKKEDAIKTRKEAENKYFGEYSYDNSLKQEQQELVE